MNSIQIDDQVYMELSRRASGFNVAPNDVLRRILNLETPITSQAMPKAIAPLTSIPSTAPSILIEFIKSDRFQRHRQAVDRFLVILGWLYATHSNKFADTALNFRRGKRLYFAKNRGKIEESGEGITAKQIPQSPLWVLTTLDNKSKRIVIGEILHTLNYSKADSNLVLGELPDSSIRRRHSAISILLKE